VKAEVAAAVPSERQHGDRRTRGRRLREQLPKQDVCAIGIALERGAATGAARNVGPKLVACGGERCGKSPGGRPGLCHGNITHAFGSPH